MNKNQNTLSTTKRGQFMRICLVALAMAIFVSFMTMAGVPQVFAGNTNIDTSGIDNVVDIIIEVIGTAAFYIGIIIVLWGVFQVIMAFRREDSEGISKQVTTIIVGGILVTFGAIADDIYNALKP